MKKKKNETDYEMKLVLLVRNFIYTLGSLLVTWYGFFFVLLRLLEFMQFQALNAAWF